MMIDAEMYGMMLSAKIASAADGAAGEHVEQAENADCACLKMSASASGLMPGIGM